MPDYSFIGAAIGGGAGIAGCEKAPEFVRHHLTDYSPLWHTILHPRTQALPISVDAYVEFSRDLAHATQAVLGQQRKFITIGGDHSCALGTWSGVAQQHKDFALIWIDAHMDAHTFDSSPSGNLHGMPVASLLGHGDSRLTSLLSPGAKLAPQHVYMLGIRSYEPAEKAFLERMGVTIYYMNSIRERGFQQCFSEVLADISRKHLPFGISFDLDGLDPSAISALGTPVTNGLSLNGVCASLKNIDPTLLIGLELTEYNPLLEKAHLPGITTIAHILQSIPGLAPIALASGQ